MSNFSTRLRRFAYCARQSCVRVCARCERKLILKFCNVLHTSRVCVTYVTYLFSTVPKVYVNSSQMKRRRRRRVELHTRTRKYIHVSREDPSLTIMIVYCFFWKTNARGTGRVSGQRENIAIGPRAIHKFVETSIFGTLNPRENPKINRSQIDETLLSNKSNNWISCHVVLEKLSVRGSIPKPEGGDAAVR